MVYKEKGVLAGIEGVIHQASNTLGKISTALMFVMMLFVVIDITGRLLFKMPLKGSTDLIELIMGLVVFLGMAYCAMEDGHARVDVIYVRLSESTRACLDVVTLSASLLIYILIAWRLFMTALGYVIEPGMTRFTDILKISHTGFIFMASLGSAVLCLELAVHIIHAFSRIGRKAEE